MWNFFILFTVELAMIMDRLYGGVCYAGIDTDPELKYPKVNHPLFPFQNILKSKFLVLRALVVWLSPTSRATSLRFRLALFSCNMETLINASKLSHTFSTIRCVMSAAGNVVAESLRHFSALTSHVFRWVTRFCYLNLYSIYNDTVPYIVLLWTLLGYNSFPSRSRVSQAIGQGRRWSSTRRSVSLVLSTTIDLMMHAELNPFNGNVLKLHCISHHQPKSNKI